MQTFAQNLQNMIASVKPARVLVALSGGVDSVVLLHRVAGLRPADLPVVALHVNHHLSPQADAWQSFCEDLSNGLGLAFQPLGVMVEARGQGLEDAARQARYRALGEVMKPGDLLLTAHHQQDQVETFFLRLLRGAGWKGLAAMEALRPMAAGWLGRPLLQTPRESIVAFASAADLSWVEDESNAETRFHRNRLRAQVLPPVYRHWPGAGRQIVRSTELLREATDLLQQYGAEELQRLDRRAERVGESIDGASWLDLTPARRYHAVHTWLSLQGLRSPERRRYAQIEQLLHAGSDRVPALAFGDSLLRRYRQRLYCLPPDWSIPNPPEGYSTEGHSWHAQGDPAAMAWDLHEPLTLPDGSLLEARPAATGLRADRRYHVTFRVAGQRSHPAGRQHSRLLKKLLQDHGLEPWLRDRLPLILDGERLAAVGDLWVERAYCSAGPDPAVRLRWFYPPPIETSAGFW